MGFALSDMTVSSPAFENGGPIPRRHTAYGENISQQATVQIGEVHAAAWAL